jgi:hypothetical protein
MFTIVAVAGLILLFGLAAADLWISWMSSDELTEMGLET